ncbi:hypothetical protein Intca_1848 [Intrasporangium calvum DSM 43043]|uniref:Uncharacterized protein n=1 Tax=Intrasporangium calvum (strain ATCC 23552 / DSM 43043 / JCM 3097 / NBRC 12989 / NCIMB 10167 / NRRL B-3866 / 7 KIP) TaxID=710696 RepID=E6SB72_INTC7|nr:hypothetical protein Intca_1848 [Intrasporangium calvum DSM 43043]
MRCRLGEGSGRGDGAGLGNRSRSRRSGFGRLRSFGGLGGLGRDRLVDRFHPRVDGSGFGRLRSFGGLGGLGRDRLVGLLDFCGLDLGGIGLCDSWGGLGRGRLGLGAFRHAFFSVTFTLRMLIGDTGVPSAGLGSSALFAAIFSTMSRPSVTFPKIV